MVHCGVGNLDARSLNYNYECGVGILDPKVGEEMEAMFQQDLQDSRSITEQGPILLASPGEGSGVNLVSIPTYNPIAPFLSSS